MADLRGVPTEHTEKQMYHGDLSHKNKHKRHSTAKEKNQSGGNGSEETRIEERTASRDSKDEKKELTEDDCPEVLGYAFPSWRKWQILTVMFFIQISINLNASLYANGVNGISEKYGISKQAARVPQLTFLVAYAFGCELWAPWSEEYGRRWVQQLSLFLVNIWQIPAAIPPNFATIIVARTLGGLSTAGGSVTLGVLADMWQPEDQEYAINYLVLSSVGGSVVGAVIGGFVERYKSLPWIFWTQLLVGGGMQIVHFFTVPETRSTILLDREAKRRRKNGEEVYGPNEIHNRRLSWREIMTIWSRPFVMLFTEPIVAWLSALSGFSDSLIFTFLQGFTPVFSKWGFGTVATSLAFLSLLVGYIVSSISFLPSIHYFRKKRRLEGPDSVEPEARLWWLRYIILSEPIGLFIFAWTGIGPKYGVPWIAPMIGSFLVGVANFAIYQSSIDYTVAAYGVYAASATGGNDFARDFLSGIAALYSVPMYTNIGSNPDFHEAYASTILGCIGILVTTPIFYFYKNGKRIRENSKFAAKIAREREQKKQRNGSKVSKTDGNSKDKQEMSEKKKERQESQAV